MSIQPTIVKSAPIVPAISSIAIKEQKKQKVSVERLGRMPSASAQISRTNFPLLQQKIFASLIYAVTTGMARRNEKMDCEPDEMEVFRWRIDLKLLRDLTYYNSHDYSLFKRSIDALVDCSVWFNLLGKDKDKTYACPICGKYMLETEDNFVCSCGHTIQAVATVTKIIPVKSNIIDAIAYKDGKLYFSFANLVNYYLEKARFRLYCKFLPRYANSLNHISSHAIYLLLLDYIDEKRGEGQTPFMDIETFAKLIGGENYLENFKSLRVKSIEPAIEEITKGTDIEVYFDRLDDIKTKGRKVTEIRIRGRRKKGSGKNKNKQQRQLTLFDESNDSGENNDSDENINNDDSKSKAKSIALFGFDIDKEEFLNFLAKDAANKNAYKARMRKLLDEGAVESLKARVDEYIAYRSERERIAKDEQENATAYEFYKRLSDIAFQEKKKPIEHLEVFTDVGFMPIASRNRDELNELSKRFEGLSDKAIAKQLYTSDERQIYEKQERSYYQPRIIKPLTDIAPMESWTMISEGKEIKVFNSGAMAKAMGFVLLGALRKIERTLKNGGNIVFKSDEKLYLGTLDNNGSLRLTLIERKQ